MILITEKVMALLLKNRNGSSGFCCSLIEKIHKPRRRLLIFLSTMRRRWFFEVPDVLGDWVMAWKSLKSIRNGE